MEAEFKRREQRWEQLFKQREEEWKDEMEKKERIQMQKLDSKIQTFHNEQLKRDEDVLTFLDKKEEKMEAACCIKQKGLSTSIRSNSKNL